MARATKKQRGTDSSAFKGAVEASEQQDELEGTGVEFDAAGPKVKVKLTKEEKAQGELHLARMNIELRKLVQDAKDTATTFKKQIKDRTTAINDFSDELDAGYRHEPAQAVLGGVQ